MSPDDLARALAQPGRASIPYLDRYNPDPPLALECFRSQAHNPDKPVVIVQLARAATARNNARHGSRLPSGTACWSSWSRVVVPDVAHEGMRMSAFADGYWFGARG